MSNKIFTVGLLRDLEKQVTAGDISYSRMVEILNEKAHEQFLRRENIPFTDEEIKWLLFYGEPNRNSSFKLDDLGRIDTGIALAFEVLEEKTIVNRQKIEEIFWKRIRAIAECNFCNYDLYKEVQAQKDISEARLIAIEELIETIEKKVKQIEILEAQLSKPS